MQSPLNHSLSALTISWWLWPNMARGVMKWLVCVPHHEYSTMISSSWHLMMAQIMCCLYNIGTLCQGRLEVYHLLKFESLFLSTIICFVYKLRFIHHLFGGNQMFCWVFIIKYLLLLLIDILYGIYLQDIMFQSFFLYLYISFWGSQCGMYNLH